MQSYSYLMSNTGVAGHYVELSEARLKELLVQVLALVDVDEVWYLQTYADVAEAVRAGAMQSAGAHYRIAGYFENRLPYPVQVDEAWYLQTYPDVAAALRAGAFASGQQHFERNGYQEGRLPRADWSLLGGSVGQRLSPAGASRRAGGS